MFKHNFTREQNPIISSLKLRSVKSEALEEEFEEFVKMKTLKTFTNEECKNIYMEMFNEPLYDIIDKYNIEVDYSEDELKQIIDFVNNKQEIPVEIVTHVLNIAVKFCAQAEKREFTMLFSTIFALLTKILDTQYSSIVENMFYYVVAELVKFYDGLQFAAFYDVIEAFIKHSSTIHPRFITTLISWVIKNKNESKGKTDSNTTEIMFHIAHLLEEYEYLRTQEVMQHITSFLLQYTNDLDPIVLTFLTKVVSFLPYEGASALFRILPQNMLEALFNEPGFLLFDFSTIKDKEAVVITNEEKYPKLIAPPGLFPNVLSVKIPVLPMIKSYRSICPKDTANSINLITKAAKNFDKSFFELCTGFKTAISENRNSPYLCEIIAVFISILKSLKTDDEEIMQSVYWLAFSTSLFSEKITFFDDDKAYENVLLTRSYVMDATLNNVPNIFIKILSSKKRYPLLLCEMLMHLTNQIAILPIQLTSSTSFINCIAEIIEYYRNIIYIGEHREEAEKVIVVIIFHFMNAIKKNSELNIIWFKDQAFKSAYLDLLFIDSLRKYILDDLFEQWATDVSIIACFDIPYFMNMFQDEEMIESLEGQNVSYDVVRKLIDISKAVPSASINIAPLYNEACCYTHHLVKDKVSCKLLHSIIILLARMTDVCKMNSSNSEILYAGIKDVEGDEPSDELFLALVSLVAGKEMETLNPEFIIAQPNAVPLLIKCFLNSKKGKDVLEFIENVCKYTQVNSELCHQGGVDTMILEIVDSRKSCDSDPNSIISSAFSLLFNIAKVISSTPVVHRFISLFCPINGRYISKMHAIFIEQLIFIVQSKIRSPYAYLPTNKDSPIIQVDEINGLELEQGFTFFIWIFYDKTLHKRHRIFTISNNLNSLRFIINGGSVSLEIITPNSTNEFRICTKIPECKWTLLGVTAKHEPNENKWVFTPSIGGVFLKRHYGYGIVFNKGMVTVTVGRDKNDGDGLLLIGPFGLIEPISNKGELLSYSNRSPMQVPQDLKKYFYVGMNVVHNQLGLNLIGSESIRIKTIGKKVLATPSFTDILVQFCKPQVILPLFAQLDLKFNDDQDTPTYGETIFPLLSNILSLDEDAQISFNEGNGMEIISFLMNSVSPRHLSFNLYKNMTKLFEHITYVPLKESMFTNLLMNANLWIKGSNDSFSSITRDWCRTLNKKYPSYVINLFPIKHFVLIISMLLWKTKPPLPDLEIERNNDFNSDVVVQNIIALIASYADESFTENDLNAIIGQIMIAKDSSIILDFISLLNMISSSDYSPFSKISLKPIINLHHLFCLSDIEITNSLIQMFLLMHHRKQLDYNVTAQIFSFTDLIPVINYSQSLMNKFIELSAIFNELYPLVFFLISMTDLDYSNLFIRKQKCSDYVSEEWLFWAAYAFVKLGVEGSSLLMDFIISVSGKKILKVYNVISIIARALHGPEYDLLNVFLEKVCHLALSLPENEQPDLTELLETLIVFLYFHPQHETSEQLGKLFEQSPFDYTAPKKQEQTLLSKDKLFNEIEHNYHTETGYVFGFRIDSEGNWKDINIAFLFCKLFCKNPNKEFSKICAITLSFIMSLSSTPKIMLIYKQLAETNLYDDLDLMTVPCGNKFNIANGTKLESSILELEEVVERVNGKVRKSEELLVNFINEARSFVYNVFKKNAIDYTLLGMQQIENEVIEQEQNFDQGKKIWHRLWNTLTFDRAPWHAAIPQTNEQHWMRDNTYCSYFVPSKTKTNNHFDDHKLASFCRDSGNSITAEKMLEEYRKARENGVEQPELLQVMSDVKKENQEDEMTMNRVTFNIEAELICLKNTTPCTFVVSNELMQIISKHKRRTIFPTNVLKIVYREILHLPVGIEIFIFGGRSFLLKLINHESLGLLRAISRLGKWQNVDIQTVPSMQYFQQQKITDQWVEGKISNFSYLMYLNRYSGRTFNDTSMYPVVPWILKKYDTDTLDLEDESMFRDLSKPMGAIDEDRLEQCVDRMEALKEMTPSLAHLYSSCYVAPLSVLLWMVRVEPFTTMHIQLQGGKFDNPSRIFSDISAAYKMSTTHDNDYRELIPEFFFMPEILLNKNNFDLGISGDKSIGDVILPKWADNALDFIYKHRKAIESSYVSKHLNEWIDIIWGYKQEGPQAEQAFNTFHPYMYKSAWSNPEFNDPMKRVEIEAMMTHCGQIPLKLFNNPHQTKKAVPKKFWLTEAKHFDTQKKGSAFAIVTHKDSSIQIIDITTDGLVNKVTISNNLTITASPLSTEVPCIDNYQSPNKFAYIPIKGKIVYGTHMGGVFISDNNEGKMLHMHFGPVNCVSSDNFFVASGGSDTAINIWHTADPNKLVCSIPSFRAEIVAIDVCSNFTTVAAATADGAVFLISTNEGKIQRVINLTKKPKRVFVTKGWGFVVVQSEAFVNGTVENYISVYTINGDLVKEKMIDFNIAYWMQWTSPQGFDYILMMTETGRLIKFEAYFLNIEEIQCLSCYNPINITYLNDLSVIVIVNKEGTVHVVPHRLDEKSKL